MSQEVFTLQEINWRRAFPFTHIFRAFRLAVYPSKVILALLALLSLYLGGHVLDSIWPHGSMAVIEPRSEVDETGRPALDTEIEKFAEFQKEPVPGTSFDKIRDDMRQRVEDMYIGEALMPLGITGDPALARDMAHNGKGLSLVEGKLTLMRNKSVEAADEVMAAELATVAHIGASEERAQHIRDVRDAHDQQVSEAYARMVAAYHKAETIRGQGIFSQFFNYEVHQINGVVDGVLAGNWFGGIHQKGAVPGVFASVLNFATVAPVWMMRCHTCYFILFTLLFLVIWAIFGGAIARISAVQVARDEAVPMRAALKFSMAKFLAFIFAPIIPLLLVLFVGGVMFLCGFFGDIPYIGPPLVGLFFFLALGAGFVMTLVLLGTACGFSLMYPTIAAEGTDSFDAISRSFNYVYKRPWRLLFLTVVAIIYDAVTYEFVYLFVHLMLSLTHHFVGASMNLRPASNLAPQWNTMWPESWSRLSYHIEWMNLNWGQSLGAVLVAFWVYLLVALVGAYVISFYFSVNSIIYSLMRREVDEIEIEEVYMEQVEENLDPTPAGEPGAAVEPPADASDTPGSSA